jgi:hypothetical protein
MSLLLARIAVLQRIAVLESLAYFGILRIEKEKRDVRPLGLGAGRPWRYYV